MSDTLLVPPHRQLLKLTCETHSKISLFWVVQLIMLHGMARLAFDGLAFVLDLF